MHGPDVAAAGPSPFEARPSPVEEGRKRPGGRVPQGDGL